jgi:hypothetical protein
MRARFTAIAVVLGVVLAGYPFASVSEGRAAAALGVLGLLSMAVALAWRGGRGLAIVATICLALHYALALHAGNVGLDVFAPLVAVGLWAFAEAMDMSIALADAAPMTRGALNRRLLGSLAVGAAGGLLALLALLARSLFAGAIASVVVGAACALGVVALPLWLAQRPNDAPPA